MGDRKADSEGPRPDDRDGTRTWADEMEAQQNDDAPSLSNYDPRDELLLNPGTDDNMSTASESRETVIVE